VQSRVVIMGGEHRSRVLETPSGADVTRPMTGRVKESIFNILRGWFDGAVVLDLFSGVGTMGLEALSRGARLAVLVERDRGVHECLCRNVAALRLEDRARPLQSDALSPATLAMLPEPADLVFMDPPYPIAEQASGKRKILEQCARLRGAMKDKGFLVLRLPYVLAEGERAIPGFDGPEVRSFGDMHVHLYAPAAARPAEASAPAEDRP
jgi:16S rRNA (guanine(966)-N(2))-methyltransferase RsmD